jgi:hypothetical protein
VNKLIDILFGGVVFLLFAGVALTPLLDNMFKGLGDDRDE